MSVKAMNLPGGENQSQNTQAGISKTAEENVQISQPHVERAEGPFEHSGETSGWTEEERKEKEEQDQHKAE
jgi:hypothetical protein